MTNHNKGLLAGLMAVLIWSGFILASRAGGVSELNTFDVIAIRYGTCATLVLPIWWLWHRFPFWQRRYVLLAMIGGIAYALTTFFGFQQAPASHAAILLPGLMPVFIGLAAWLFAHERPMAMQLAGMALVVLAVMILIVDLVLTPGFSFGLGHLAFMAGALCWALMAGLVKRWQISPWETTITLAVVTAAIYLPVYVVGLPKSLHLASASEILLQAVYQGFLATIVQMVLFVYAVRQLGASQMGSLMALVPVLAGLAAIPLFGEPASVALIVALVLGSGGVWLANTKIPMMKRRWQ